MFHDDKLLAISPWLPWLVSPQAFLSAVLLRSVLSMRQELIATPDAFAWRPGCLHRMVDSGESLTAFTGAGLDSLVSVNELLAAHVTWLGFADLAWSSQCFDSLQ